MKSSAGCDNLLKKSNSSQPGPVAQPGLERWSYMTVNGSIKHTINSAWKARGPGFKRQVTYASLSSGVFLWKLHEQCRPGSLHENPGRATFFNINLRTFLRNIRQHCRKLHTLDRRMSDYFTSISFMQGKNLFADHLASRFLDNINRH